MEVAELEATVERCREGDEDAWGALVSATVRPSRVSRARQTTPIPPSPSGAISS